MGRERPDEEAPEAVRTRRKEDPDKEVQKPVVDFEAIFIPDSFDKIGLYCMCVSNEPVAWVLRVIEMQYFPDENSHQTQP